MFQDGSGEFRLLILSALKPPSRGSGHGRTDCSKATPPPTGRDQRRLRATPHRSDPNGCRVLLGVPLADPDAAEADPRRALLRDTKPGGPAHGCRERTAVRPSSTHPFTTPERFHALLNSLFKVLFNFPSRYLFAIGLVAVSSFRRSLPPA